MTSSQQRAMAAGRQRAQRARERAACQRVRQFVRWLKAGSKLRDIPAIPSDADWHIARHRGIVK